MERRLRLKLPNGKFVNVSASRSRIMSAIRSKNTRSTELVLRSALIRCGIQGWRVHATEVIGSPDIYFPKQKLAVFVDGCFWHGCSKCGHIPKTRQVFWKAKIARNKNRDKKVKRSLAELGIHAVRIWEHELKRKPSAAVHKIVKTLGDALQPR